MSTQTTPSHSEGGIIHILTKVVETIASAAIVIMVILVVLEVLLRSTFGFSFGFVDEIVAYLVVLITFFGACVTFKNRALFKVEIFYGKIPKKIRRVFDLIHSFLSLVLCFTLIYYSFFLVSSSYERQTVSPTKLETPLYIPQLIIPIGLIILVIFIIDFAFPNLFRSKSVKITEDNE
ncbi:MAG: TRAP transporter small permease [Desulfuromonadales bacterium]|jgi:TRAP-type C4-dicarboxylate transport system permease small subunit